METLGYRNIQHEDVSVIFEMGKEHFGSPAQYSWDWSVRKVEEYTDTSFGSGVVCTDKEKLIGFALAQNRYSEQRPNVAWLTYVVVNPAYKGKGIGKTLTTKLTDLLKSKGVTEIITDIYENNTDSLAFFEKQGFDVKERWFILARKI